MSLFLSNRDGGLTDEQGHYRFQTNVWSGNVIGNGLQVTQNSPLGMSVIVGEGDARVPYAGYAYTAWNDANEVVTISTANPSNPRIDRLVMYIDRGETPQQVNPNNPGIPKFAVVAGTPAAVPTRPSNAAVNSAVGATNPWIDLADILVNAGVTQITNANITDTRTVVRPVSTGISVGTISGSILGTPGSKSITGVGFKPRLVEFQVLPNASSGASGTGRGLMHESGYQWATYSSSNASSNQSARNTYTNRCIMWLAAASSTATFTATYSSMDDDGFTISVISPDSAFNVGWVAYE